MAFRTTAVLRLAGVLLLCAAAAAQTAYVTLEQVNSRRSSDFAPTLEGETVTVHGTVSTYLIQFSFFNHIAIQDDSGHGLVLESTLARLSPLEPGDWLEVRGTVSKRAGLPVLLPAEIRIISRGPAPLPRRVSTDDLRSFENLGLLVSTEGRIVDKGENTGGEYLLIGDPKRPLKVFLPQVTPHSGPAHLGRFEMGDRVRVTGIAAQYCPFAPYNRYFEVVIGDADNVVLLSKRWLISPELFMVSVAALGFALGVWWMRERRMAAQRRMVRTFYALGEEISGAGSPGEILRRLTGTLPAALDTSGVQLYLYNRTAKTLERVDADFALEVYPPEGSLPLGAAACFRNQAMLTIPDTRRSPFFPDGRGGEYPRSILFVPMFADTEITGVLEVSDHRPAHDYSQDERVLTQHLANQIGIALRLIEEKTIREQLYRSEKLAAVGQLITGVASELKTPLETISARADELRAAPPGTAWEHVREISQEAAKASEIVSRLVSFMQPEQVEARRIELNALLRSLIGFRRPEWEARGLAVSESLSPVPIYVMGSQGQLERVFLDLLIQAEQALAEAPEKKLTLETSVLARRVLVEIGYGVNPLKTAGTKPGVEREAAGGLPAEGVSGGIVRSHGGELRLVRSPAGECRLEVDLPEAPPRPAGESGHGPRALTCLAVEPDRNGCEELVHLLTNRGCRVIPAGSAEEGAELVQRLRFDVVFCAVRLPGLNWVEFSERVRGEVAAFVLLSEGFDHELSRGLLTADTKVLARPVSEPELDELLAQVESRLALLESAHTRGLQIVRKAI